MSAINYQFIFLKKTSVFLSLAILLFIFIGCGPKQSPAPPPSVGPTKSILFIGNSFTYVNDLPNTFAQLASWGSHAVTTIMIAPGGYRLVQHAVDPGTLNTIANGKWDYVVLQEQSQVPAIKSAKTNEMYPAVRALNDKIKSAGAIPILYMTWGRAKGCIEMGYSDYFSMQEQLTLGYMGIANELGIEVSPVGEAWKLAHTRKPDLALWGGDGIHPSTLGTYLAACVFYAVLYRESPVGLKFTDGLSNSDAQFLQSTAAEVVLTDPKAWNINP